MVESALCFHLPCSSTNNAAHLERGSSTKEKWHALTRTPNIGKFCKRIKNSSSMQCKSILLWPVKSSHCPHFIDTNKSLSAILFLRYTRIGYVLNIEICKLLTSLMWLAQKQVSSIHDRKGCRELCKSPSDYQPTCKFMS